MIKSRKMVWGHLELLVDMRNVYACAGKREREKILGGKGKVVPVLN
jgi:hypothetical protein